MTTPVSIASNALLLLGADPINSFDEGEESGSNIDRARLAANLWPSVRRRVLRGGTWNCALKRVVLSPDATAPAFGFSRQFLRPSDWLRTVQIGLTEYDRDHYRTEGNLFLSDQASLPLLYVFDQTNADLYDAILVDSLELAMAARMAYPVTKSASLAAEFAGLAAESLRMARGTDGQDDPPETLHGYGLLQSRRGGRRY